MNGQSFDHLTRRASLATLGIAALSGVLGHAPATSAKQSAGKKARKKCKNQVSQCLSRISQLCENDAGCQQTLPACCQQLSGCDFNAFLICATAPRN